MTLPPRICPPVFVIVKVRSAVWPTTTVPKLSAVGATSQLAASSPKPLAITLAQPAPVSIVQECSPAVVGAKRTVKVAASPPVRL